ncbi:MAG: hypothetical protein ACK5IP_16480 [Paracoccus sp. (in: a-proteobacteria)]
MRGFVGAVVLAGVATPVAAQDCAPIRFARGSSGAEVQGVVQPESQVCHSIEVAVGQQMRLSVTGSAADLAFTVIDEADNRSELSFTTRQTRYEILVHQTFRSVAPASYVLSVAVD